MIRIVGSPEPDEKCNQEGMHGIHFLAGRPVVERLQWNFKVFIISSRSL